MFTSSIRDMVLHPSYQRIIGMGADALPFILGRLDEEPDHWFWALEAITGVNPVPEEEQGNIARMTERWLDWAKEEAIID